MLTAATLGSLILPCLAAINSATMLTANLLRRDRPDIEADRRVNPLQGLVGHSLTEQLVEDPAHLRLASNQSPDTEAVAPPARVACRGRGYGRG
jgi:hypothetical protein